MFELVDERPEIILFGTGKRVTSSTRTDTPGDQRARHPAGCQSTVSPHPRHTDAHQCADHSMNISHLVDDQHDAASTFNMLSKKAGRWWLRFSSGRNRRRGRVYAAGAAASAVGSVISARNARPFHP